MVGVPPAGEEPEFDINGIYRLINLVNLTGLFVGSAAQVLVRGQVQRVLCVLLLHAEAIEPSIRRVVGHSGGEQR